MYPYIYIIFSYIYINENMIMLTDYGRPQTYCNLYYYIKEKIGAEYLYKGEL